MKRDRNSRLEITLRLTLEKPTAGVDFALQKGRGSSFTTEQKQRSIGRDLKFEFPVTVKTRKDGAGFYRTIRSGSGGRAFLLYQHRNLRGADRDAVEPPIESSFVCDYLERD